MRFLADENFPLPSVRILSAARHDVAAVVQDSPGVADETVLERAVREARILLTFDRDSMAACFTNLDCRLPRA